MSRTTYIKQYNAGGNYINLPAHNYWLLREESILSYLQQRGAKVPKVFLKNIEEQSITLEYVGQSFDKVFLNSNIHSSSVLFQCLYLATIEIYKIFDLGVLHLDIAARNFTVSSKTNDHVYILDFAHSISSNTVLQKPLPLIPQPETQHPDLVSALMNDWENFFLKTKNEVPNLNQIFEVDNKVFCDYWTENLSIQRIQTSYPVLCHGLGQFYIEMSASPILSTNSKIFLLNLGHNLRFITNGSGKLSIEKAIHDLHLYSQNLEENEQGNHTQIPLVQNIQRPNLLNEDNIHDEYLAEKNTTDSVQIKDSFLVNLNVDNIKTNNRKFLFKVSGLTWGWSLLAWLTVIVHGIWLDNVVSATKLKIDDWFIYLILFLIFLALIHTIVLCFQKRWFDAFVRKLPRDVLLINIGILAYLMVNVGAHYIIWMPSLLLITVATFLMRKKIKG